MALYERLLGYDADARIWPKAFCGMLRERVETMLDSEWLGYIINACDLDAGEQDQLAALLAVYVYIEDFDKLESILAIGEARLEPYDSAAVVERRCLAEAPVVTLVTPADSSSSADTTPTFSGVAGIEPGDKAEVSIAVTDNPPTTNVQVLAGVPVASDGSYSVDASPALAAGDYLAIATQITVYGIEGATVGNAFTVTA
jgi:hypothetical protein